MTELIKGRASDITIVCKATAQGSPLEESVVRDRSRVVLQDRNNNIIFTR